jgi:excisionase family DNA binding protein
MTATLEAVALAWSGATEGQRSAALAALRGEPAAPPGPGQMLNLTTAAKRAGVGRTTLWRAIRAGSLRTVSPVAGGNPRVLESELDRWQRGEG